MPKKLISYLILLSLFLLSLKPVLQAQCTHPIFFFKLKAWQYFKITILIGSISKAQFLLAIYQKQKLATWHYFVKSPKLSILGKILYHKYFT